MAKKTDMRKLITGSLGFVLLASCAPMITTNVVMREKALGENQKVVIYNHKEQVPDGYKILGSVDADDAGFTTNCDSLNMIVAIKRASRKIGGNAFLITEYKHPPLSGSNCHNFKGFILSIPFTEQTEEDDNDLLLNKQQLISRCQISLYGGWSYRLGEVREPINDIKSYAKGLMSGYNISGTGSCYFNEYLGMGLIVSISNYYNEASNVYTGRTFDNLSDDITIGYIAPCFALRVIGNEKHTFLFDTSIGILWYNDRAHINSQLVKITGINMGFGFDIGYSYSIVKNIAVGVKMSLIAGYLSSYILQTKDMEQEIKLDKEDYESLSQFNLTAGIRFNF